MVTADQADGQVGDPRRAETLASPTPRQAREFVAGALAADAVVTVVGRCTVAADGQAGRDGNRLVLCKPDGTTLVHSLAGHRPLDRRPAGSVQEWRVTDGCLELSTHQETAGEPLCVTFTGVDRVTSHELSTDPDQTETRSEADLRERLLADPELLEPGFRPLATERETPAGPVDVYGEDDRGRRVVVELKRGRAGPAAVGQLDRYVTALGRDLHADATVRGVLVAPTVTPRARRLLARKGLEFVAVAPESTDADRQPAGDRDKGSPTSERPDD